MQGKKVLDRQDYFRLVKVQYDEAMMAINLYVSNKIALT